ncbi:ABC transporter ATP-binding protein [Neisseria lisongii]|uniref:Dipeptide ABC transporter ATP-binding protein n=1 Tax=Neisseria lisongii TaxID=2912188 RepID=A0AAW5ACP8_9NEIS|nr:dipeptide ABC transporter ATP-binding protein [Neisseria lisongii]MCF7528840.1 dipeptide ABC transporter ATP-binding protein [Neisseria lisongii]
METILEIQGLNAAFPDKQVLHDINLKVAAGSRLAVVGESGSGKTVLAQAMMRLNPVVRLQGRLKFAGEDLLNLSEKALQKRRGREIGMVFQEPMTALNPVMTVGKQIAEVLTLHLGLNAKQAWLRAVELLAETGIRDAAEKAKAYPFQLSGGQRQRAMIAMAVAGEPKLLIADEPTTALDAVVQTQILDLLARLQQQRNMTLIYITHDLNLVRRFADSVVVMQQGRIVEQGNAQTLFADPQHEYTRILLGSGQTRHAAPLPDNAPILLEARQLAVAVKESAGWWKKRSKTLLEPLDFTLKSGETLGIIGESGSGKTTLAKAVLRLIPFAGRLKMHGQDLSRQSRRAVQIVFQDPFGAFNPRMNIFETVSEALRVHEPSWTAAQKRQRVAEVLQQVGLDEEAMQRFPHEFSGGQRQRIAIARALAVRPEILVLDEPTSALDKQWQQQIIDLLAELQQQYRLSMMIVSHDLNVIHALSHRVMVLKEGRVVEAGDCRNVFANPHAPYTQKLLSGFTP